MVYSIAINTSVCTQIGAECLSWCDYAGGIMSYADEAAFAFEISLLAIGGVLVVKGITHGVVAVKLIRGDHSNDPHVQDYIRLRSEGSFIDAMAQPNQIRNKRYGILSNLFTCVDLAARATLPLLAGYVLYKFQGADAHDRLSCAQINFTNGCDLAMKFFIQAIDNVIGVEAVQ